MKKILYLILFLTLILVGCTWYQVREVKIEFGDYGHKIDPTEYTFVVSHSVKGRASWYDYGLKNYPNYSKENYTAASRDYPRGTKLRVCRIEINVTRLRAGKWQDWPCVDVRVNDYVENPDVIIDLSSKAFAELADLKKGIIDVEIIKL